jgi:hypothetical protein
MIVLPYTGASRYHACRIDRGTRPEYVTYTLLRKTQCLKFGCFLIGLAVPAGGGGASTVYDVITISSQIWGGDYNVVSTDTHTHTSHVTSHAHSVLTRGWLLDHCGSIRHDAIGVRLSHHHITTSPNSLHHSHVPTNPPTPDRYTAIPKRVDSITIFSDTNITQLCYITYMYTYAEVRVRWLGLSNSVLLPAGTCRTVRKSVKRLKLHNGQKCVSSK